MPTHAGPDRAPPSAVVAPPVTSTIVARMIFYHGTGRREAHTGDRGVHHKINAIGVGAFFNVLNFGQMYGFHIVILPVIVSALVGLHLLLVRMRGVVRPYPAPGEEVRP
jgi:hypothetical protein